MFSVNKKIGNLKIETWFLKNRNLRNKNYNIWKILNGRINSKGEQNESMN